MLELIQKAFLIEMADSQISPKVYLMENTLGYQSLSYTKKFNTLKIKTISLLPTTKIHVRIFFIVCALFLHSSLFMVLHL